MNSAKNSPNKRKPSRKKSNSIYIASGVLILLAAAFIIINSMNKAGAKNPAKDGTAAQSGGDVTITMSDITEKAAFIPYKSGAVDMELIAVKAPDGTIRTALNTCQVCYDSGRGYYVQEGNELVCQNCGNRFKISQIEKEKNGCNPVPIPEDYKSDDGQTITISSGIMSEYAPYFKSWKR